MPDHPTEIFENRLWVLKALGAIREIFPKPHQLRYPASFTSVVGLMFVRRMMLDGGQSEMHRLLALEQLTVADPRMTAKQARDGAAGRAAARGDPAPLAGPRPRLHGAAAAIYAYGDASRRAAGRLSDSAGTTRNLTLLPPETWRTFARTASRDEPAPVLEGFVFDAPAPWHAPAAIVAAVEDLPRPTPPRPSVPDRGLSDSAAAPEYLTDRRWG